MFSKKNNKKKKIKNIDEKKLFDNILDIAVRQNKNTIGIQFNKSLLNMMPENIRNSIIEALDEIGAYVAQEISLYLFSQDLYFAYMAEKSVLLKKYIELSDEKSANIDKEIDEIEKSMYMNDKINYH